MFDGKVGGPRSSATSAKRRDTKASAKDLVEKAKKERENRALMRQRNDAAKSYQTLYRKYMTQQKEFDRVRSEFDKKLSGICVFKTALKAQGVNFLPPVATMTELMQQLSFFFRDYADSARMVQLQQLLVDSIASNDANYNVLLNKDSVQRERSEFLVVRMLKCALILLPALCRSGDAEHADLIVRSASAVCRERTNASQAGRWNIRIFDLLALCVGELHQLYGTHPSMLVESTLAKITDLLVHLFQTSMASDLPSRIQCISERIFSIANLQSNALLSRSLQAIALSDVVQHSGDHLLEHFLYAAQAANNWIQRFYCIANFSHLFLSNVSSDTRVLERVRIPWIKAIRTLFQDNLTNTVAMSSSSSTTTAAASATAPSSGLFTSKPTSTTSAAKASSALTPHGIPLVLYLCRNTPGFPLLLLESEDHHPSTTGDHHPSAMDIDFPIHEESNDDPAATLRSAWQAQEQEIFTEYLVGDGNRKLEIRISMILNEIARRENKFFVSHQAQVIMDPIEAILKVLTNRDIAAALFGILAESGQSLPTQLSVVAVYAKVLMSYPYKVLDTANTGIGVTQTSKAQATTREALLRTLAFSRPSAPIALLLWQFLWQHFESIVPLLIMSDKKTVISDMRFQQSALTCEMDTETLYQTLIALIYLFCAIFNQQLSATDDQELFSGSFVSTATLIDMTRFLRQWFYKIFWTEPTCDLMSSFLHPQEQMISYTSVLQYSSLMASMRLFHQLCIRHERRPYLADSDYQWPSLPSYEFELVDAETSERYYQVDRDNNILLNATANREGTFFVKNPNLQTVLTCIPQVIPFTQRVALFQSLVDHDKKEYFSALSGRLNIDEMIAGGQIVRISVRRDHMLEDAMTGLHVLGLRMKGRVQVEFISEQGFAEAGIDGGGLFKEFMDDFAQLISDPALGLFETTTDHLLTPNPASAYMIGKLAAPLTKSLETKPNAHKSSSTASANAAAATGIPTSGVITVSFDPRNDGSSSSNPNKRMKAGSLRDRSHLELFEFAGKMLGKALYEVSVASDRTLI